MSRETLEAVTPNAQGTTNRAVAHHPGRNRPVEGWRSMTDTERQVALLVAEGLTNAQVGQRMFRSRHTIDTHLRQIFRKLNVHSRVAMTRRVLEMAPLR
jgi:DNA-binding CsgD family transcriptional regulator